MPTKAKAYIALVIAAGLILAGASWIRDGGQFPELSRFLGYLSLACLASTMKVRLPAMRSTMSVNFLFILIGIAELPLFQAVTIGAIATVIQCCWKSRTPARPIQVMFNVSALVISINGAYLASRAYFPWGYRLAPLLFASTVFFIVNTGLVTTVVGLVSRKSISALWRQCHLWTFPYYLVGAAIAACIVFATESTGWRHALLIAPLMYLVYRYYGMVVPQQVVEQPAGGSRA
jgi:hypothetical protein